ncbi:MAG TPA: hypothetical protein VGP41_04420 [Candidatus Lustribacter sp.]|jgi:hypothetical protein|nr:hypothetical protein [Candidatus Lustribacter sp.]
MEHWFDRATKALVGGNASRRGVLEGAALAGVATMMPVSGLTRPFGGEQFAAVAAPCVRGGIRGARTTTVSSSGMYQGQALAFQSTWSTNARGYSSGTFAANITLGGRPLYDFSVRFTPGFQRPSGGSKAPAPIPLLRADIRSAPAIAGPRHIVLKASNAAVAGRADGRPVTSALRAPAVSVEPALQSALRDLVGSARANLSQCRSIAADPALRVAASRRSNFLTLQQTRRAPVLAERPMQIAQGDQACQDCYNACDNTAQDCGGGALLSALANPLAALGALGGCVKNYYDCENNCSKPGGVCCSVQCNGGQYCCAEGQQCCGGLAGTPPACCDGAAVCVSGIYEGVYQYSYCCPGGTVGCQASNGAGQVALYCRQPNGTCCGLYGACGAGQTCVDAEYGICCPAGQSLCNDICCNGTCITTVVKGANGTSVSSQTCCAPGQVNCGGTCCAPETCRTTSKGASICCPVPLCGDTCCTSPATCQSGKCIYPNLVGTPCGNTYCPHGYKCVRSIYLGGDRYSCVGPPGSKPLPTPMPSCPPGQFFDANTKSCKYLQ